MESTSRRFDGLLAEFLDLRDGGLCRTPGWTSWVADAGGAGLREVHGVTEHLRILRSTSPPVPGGGAGSVDYSPLELQLASNFTLAS